MSAKSGKKNTFQKGNKGKPKGVKNKKTVILDNFAKHIVEGGQEKFERELKKLRGSAYVKAYMAMFEYVKPKLARTDVKLTAPKGSLVVMTQDEATKKAVQDLK